MFGLPPDQSPRDAHEQHSGPHRGLCGSAACIPGVASHLASPATRLSGISTQNLCLCHSIWERGEGASKAGGGNA